MSNCGIYSITNTSNGKRYIGSSSLIERRFTNHKSSLNRGVHTNKYLQSSWNKYGKDSFIFEIVNECSKDDLIEMECYFIKAFDSMDRTNGYNAYDPKKQVITDEHRKNLSLSHMGQKAWNKGIKLSDEGKKKLSEAHKGQLNLHLKDKKHSEEQRLKNSLSNKGRCAWNKGIKCSEETKRKISDTKMRSK